MNVVNDLFFELLQVAIGNRLGLSRVPTPEEWEEIYEMSKKQSLAGIAFAGVERLPQEQMPPGKRIRQWAVKAEKIREHNVKVSEDCRVISRFFEENGFDCVILKGQGNFAYYPEWLQGLRSSGDIDVWCWPKGKKNGNVNGNYNKDNKDNETQSEIATIREHGSLRYGASAYENGSNNKDNRDNKDNIILLNSLNSEASAEVLNQREARFEPAQRLNLLNQRAIASDLNSLNSEASAEVLNQRGARLELFKKLGLKEFAGAVMYVLREVFAMPEERMLCRPDEKRGKKLLEEIMIGGNFGKFDDRYNWAETTSGSMDYRGASYAVARLRHNFQFLRDYPSEVLWELVFRVYHWVWRKFQLWKFE